MIIKKYNIAFAGTSHIAIPFIESVLRSDKFNVSIVLTKKISSKKRYTIYDYINENQNLFCNVEIFYVSPNNIPISAFNVVDAMLVVSYGYKIPKQIIDTMPCINMHASLLPQLRGAAPIEYAIINGTSSSGITVMQMHYDIDTGPIISQYPIEMNNIVLDNAVYPVDDYYDVENKIMLMSDKFVCDAYRFLQGDLMSRPQDHELASYAPPIHHKDSILSFEMSGIEIFNRIRALCCINPCKIQINQYKMKILKARLHSSSKYHPSECGLITSNENRVKKLNIQLKDSVLEILEIILDSRKRMTGEDFCRGHGGGLVNNSTVFI